MNISNASLTGIPADVKKNIIDYMDGRSLGRLCVADKSYNLIIKKAQDLWKKLSVGESNNFPDVKDWKVYFAKHAVIRRNMQCNNLRLETYQDNSELLNHVRTHHFYSSSPFSINGGWGGTQQFGRTLLRVFDSTQIIMEQKDVLDAGLEGDKLIYQDQDKIIHLWDLSPLQLLMCFKSEAVMQEFVGSIGNWVFYVERLEAEDSALVGLNCKTFKTHKIPLERQSFLETVNIVHFGELFQRQELRNGDFDTCKHSTGAITIFGTRGYLPKRSEVLHLDANNELVVSPTEALQTICSNGFIISCFPGGVKIQSQSNKDSYITVIADIGDKFEKIQVVGKFLIMYSNLKIRLWDFVTKESAFKIKKCQLEVIDYLFFIADEDKIVIYNPFDGELAVLRYPKNATLSFYDGKILFKYPNGTSFCDLYKPLPRPPTAMERIWNYISRTSLKYS